MSYPFGSGMPQPNSNEQQAPLYPPMPQQQQHHQAPYPTAYGGQFGGYQQQQPQPAAYQTYGGVGQPTYAAQTPQYPPQPQQATVGGYAVYPPAAQPHFGGYPPMAQQQPQQPPQHGGFAPSFGGYPPQQQPPYQQPPPVNSARNSGGGSVPHQHQLKGTPIIRPANPFNPVEDAKALRKAMKGLGTDENGLIAVLCHRSNEQIQRIKLEYKTNFGRDLLEDIKSETSGNFERVLVALLLPRLDYYAKELNDAMAGLGTDEDALVEILCSLSNYEIQAIKHHYKQVYYKDLEAELISETSGHFKRLLVSLCAGGRDESGVVDGATALQDAQALLRAGELRAGTDESTFNMIICQRNYGQIRAICEEYKAVTGHSLVKAIENEFSGDIRDGLVAVVQCMSNKAEFFATRLHKSMAGIGTTDSQLIRVLVMRSEIDLADVKVEFERLYKKSLRSWIKGDTSGHYKHALYNLIGESPSS